MLVSTAAFGFEEQKAVTPAPGEGGPAAGAVEAPGSTELAPSGPAVKPEGGTAVRIPGLGTLGVLPKMDFGLELLYGANDPKPQAEEERELPAEDLTVRGTVKHQF